MHRIDKNHSILLLESRIESIQKSCQNSVIGGNYSDRKIYVMDSNKICNKAQKFGKYNVVD